MVELSEVFDQGQNRVKWRLVYDGGSLTEYVII